MIDLKIENRKGKIHVKSSEIKDILELRPDFRICTRYIKYYKSRKYIGI